MAEYVRSIRVSLEIDTNKRTISRTIDADSVEDAESRLLDMLADVRDDL